MKTCVLFSQSTPLRASYQLITPAVGPEYLKWVQFENLAKFAFHQMKTWHLLLCTCPRNTSLVSSRFFIPHDTAFNQE